MRHRCGLITQRLRNVDNLRVTSVDFMTVDTNKTTPDDIPRRLMMSEQEYESSHGA